jgi:hypothetical protein
VSPTFTGKVSILKVFEKKLFSGTVYFMAGPRRSKSGIFGKAGFFSNPLPRVSPTSGTLPLCLVKIFRVAVALTPRYRLCKFSISWAHNLFLGFFLRTQGPAVKSSVGMVRKRRKKTLKDAVVEQERFGDRTEALQAAVAWYQGGEKRTLMQTAARFPETSKTAISR